MDKKPNMRNIAGEDHKPEPRGNPGIVIEGAVKGDKSESGSNSYAKNNQSAIVKLKNSQTQPFSKYADSQKRGF